MATFKRSFGSDTPSRRADETDKTANAKKEEAKTGRPVGSGVGDSTPSAGLTGQGSSGNRRTPAPSGTNKDLWAEAERQWQNQGGGAGVDPTQSQVAIQERYDQMIDNDKATKKWAGKDGVLGDV